MMGNSGSYINFKETLCPFLSTHHVFELQNLLHNKDCMKILIHFAEDALQYFAIKIDSNGKQI